ncbi:hypothetical protein [Radiobacillus deserti]|uniref:LacI family transcriptional regulator n=1 Tax=Radiobacillus deserti TaxID=2594883 RepID=A0A516KKH8_9BACI|nr:hypothetical protein [Radiobacillus deserti]QDP41878.1 hypothetical protein FN924_17890 [Radiobacillus deserti]
MVLFLWKAGVPFVVIGKPVSNTSEIMYADKANVQASKDAIEHLIQLGHPPLPSIIEQRDSCIAYKPKQEKSA